MVVDQIALIDAGNPISNDENGGEEEDDHYSNECQNHKKFKPKKGKTKRKCG